MSEQTRKDKNSKKIFLIIILILLLLGGAVAGVRYFNQNQNPEQAAKAVRQAQEAVAALDIKQGDAAPAEVTSTPAPDADPTPTPEPYVSPIDFQALQKANPDIFGWLYIPGTEINYPLLQREGDDEYYLYRNADGQEDIDGSIFSQATYNKNDMSDPVTVLYGHHMNSGAMFGTLQETYSQTDAVRDYADIIVYMPTEEIHYTVFAAVPTNKLHILHYYDCKDAEKYQLLLDRLRAIRAVGANFNDKVEVTPEDKTLILSTCLSGNSDKRYLVLAKRT